MAQRKRARSAEVSGSADRPARKESLADEPTFKVRTLAEVEYFGAMIETVLANAGRFGLTPDMKLQHETARMILLWVRCTPDIPDFVKQMEGELRACGFVPPSPLKVM